MQGSWEKQCLKLTAEERELFLSHACSNLEDYLQSIQKAYERNKDQDARFKALEWVEPIFRTIELLTPALAIGVQAYPNPGSLVLGAISAIVHAFSRLTSYLRLTVQVLGEMAHKASVFFKYDGEIYNDEPALQDAIIRVYGDILVFCRKAFRFKKRNGKSLAKIKGVALVLFTNFESHFDQELQNFRNHVDEVESLASICDKRRLERLLKTQEIQRADFDSMAQEARDYFHDSSYRERLLINLTKRESAIRERKCPNIFYTYTL